MYVSPVAYQSYTCQQLALEAQGISARAASLSGAQDSQRTKDGLVMAPASSTDGASGLLREHVSFCRSETKRPQPEESWGRQVLKRFVAVAIDSAVSLQSLRCKPLNQSSDEPQ